MPWNKTEIDNVARGSADADFKAFEAIGLADIDDALVLDVGCFDGFNTYLKFGPYVNIKEVVGLDPEKEALDLASRDIADPRFTWLNARFEDINLENSSFDVIYFSHTFQHFPDKQAAMKKAFELLRDGGWIVIKTVDDSMKTSYPDEDKVMLSVFDLYENYVLPNVAHTANTDRNFGKKCNAILACAGFKDIKLIVTHANTVGLDRGARETLFDRMTYFRYARPKGVPEEVSAALDCGLSKWKEMFLENEYFFDSPTLTYVASKNPSCPRAKSFDQEVKMAGTSISIRQMREDDLGQVMSIELDSFSDPWAPVAYTSELRHNNQAIYLVAEDGEGVICGYLGVWDIGSEALITHIAVAKNSKRQGIGTAMINAALSSGALSDANEIKLLVRSGNSEARHFYSSMGFAQVGCIPNYYTNPSDDGISMVKPIGR